MTNSLPFICAESKASDKIKDILRLDNQGIQRKEIARRLDVHQATVTRACLVAGHERKRALFERERRYDEEIRERYDAGLSDAEISRQLGISGTTVMNWRRYNGLPPHTWTTVHPLITEIRELLERGYSYSEVARALDLKSRNVVAGAIHRFNKLNVETLEIRGTK